jgi:hypothetical protein
MKKILSFLVVAALVVSCSKTDEVQPSSYIISGHTATASTRVYTADLSDLGFMKPYTFWWSDGDMIWVGSQPSDPLTESSIYDSGIDADFVLPSVPQSGDQVIYNMKANTPAEASTAVVPAEQDASKSLGENGAFGQTELNGTWFSLENKTNFVTFNIKDLPEGATLTSIRLDAGDAIVAGSAAWSSTDGWGEVSNGSSTIDLKVNKNTVSSSDYITMVILPPADMTIPSATITYELEIEGVKKYYDQTLGSKTFDTGEMARVTVDLSKVELYEKYELRTLTFEDADAKFTAYSLDYAPKDIRTWSNLVDDAQYGGTLTYSYGGEYYWYDEGNTELFHSFTTPLWGGGHVISNYVMEDYSTLPDGHSGWYELQMANPIGGHNGSANFAVHNGYSDFFNSQMYDASLQTLEFADGEERVIDHMWVTNTNYLLNSLTYGDGFNSPATDTTFVKVIAYGYDANDNETGSVELYLCKDGVCLTEWAKWDLSSLGKVAKVAFNFAASEDQSGGYGLNCPAYFAYDDVTVRF